MITRVGTRGTPRARVLRSRQRGFYLRFARPVPDLGPSSHDRWRAVARQIVIVMAVTSAACRHAVGVGDNREKFTRSADRLGTDEVRWPTRESIKST